MAVTTEAPARPAAPGMSETPARALPRGTTSLGMGLLLVADAMVLVVLLATYFSIKGASPRWPAPGVHLSTYLPTVLTVTAVMSACSVAWMLFAVRRNDQRNAVAAAILTVVLGLAMGNAQWYAMTHATFGVNQHAYGSLYYLLIGYHLVHLIAGMVMVGVVAAQALAGHYSREDHEPVRAVAWFWQYGNLAWVTIVIALFALSRHSHK